MVEIKTKRKKNNKGAGLKQTQRGLQQPQTKCFIRKFTKESKTAKKHNIQHVAKDITEFVENKDSVPHPSVVIKKTGNPFINSIIKNSAVMDNWNNKYSDNLVNYVDIFSNKKEFRRIQYLFKKSVPW